MPPARRVHEWVWGDRLHRTVCGLATHFTRHLIVEDLGAVPLAKRCGNCERQRAAIGMSRIAAAAPAAPSGESAHVFEAAAAAQGPLTARELDVMSHATGFESRWPFYRNHFCAGPTHDAWSTIQGLIGRGMMRVSREPSPISGGDTVFCVTAIGIAALKREMSRRAGEALQQAE
jgi:hypothetical protein